MLPGSLLCMKPTVPHTVPSWSEIYSGSRVGEAGQSTIWQKRLEYAWDIIGGKYRFGMLGLPHTYPAKLINGWWVAGYPATLKMTVDICFPKNIRERMDGYEFSIVEEYKIGSWAVRTMNAFDEVTGRNDEIVNNQIRLIKELYEEEPVEVLWVQFSFVDHLLHLIGWEDFHPFIKETTEYVYSKLDSVVEELYRHFQPKTLFICSDHGHPKPFQHHPEGILGIYGVHINDDVELTVNTCDLLPTMLYLLDIPRKLQGEVIYALFQSHNITEEDHEIMKNQLKKLGYIE